MNWIFRILYRGSATIDKKRKTEKRKKSHDRKRAQGMFALMEKCGYEVIPFPLHILW